MNWSGHEALGFPTIAQRFTAIALGIATMGDAGAIEDASETLVGVLEDRIDRSSVDVVLSSPDTVTSSNTPTVGLFLYKVTENPHESTLQRTEATPGTVRPGPLVVDLHYLVTAYPPGGSSGNQKTMRQHGLLGEAMRAFRDEAVIRGSELKGSIEDELRISQGDGEDAIMDIWNTFPKTPYLPSVAYTVGPVSLGAGEPVDADRVETITRRGDDA